MTKAEALRQVTIYEFVEIDSGEPDAPTIEFLLEHYGVTEKEWTDFKKTHTYANIKAEIALYQNNS